MKKLLVLVPILAAISCGGDGTSKILSDNYGVWEGTWLSRDGNVGGKMVIEADSVGNIKMRPAGGFWSSTATPPKLLGTVSQAGAFAVQTPMPNPPVSPFVPDEILEGRSAVTSQQAMYGSFTYTFLGKKYGASFDVVYKGVLPDGWTPTSP